MTSIFEKWQTTLEGGEVSDDMIDHVLAYDELRDIYGVPVGTFGYYLDSCRSGEDNNEAHRHGCSHVAADDEREIIRTGIHDGYNRSRTAADYSWRSSYFKALGGSVHFYEDYDERNDDYRETHHVEAFCRHSRLYVIGFNLGTSILYGSEDD